MQQKPTFRMFLAMFLIFIASIYLVQAPNATAASQPSEHSQGAVNKADVCALLPDPPGNANGIHKQCPALGSSSGITKGDFNGDGFADLAIGEPGAAVGGAAGAGDVIVIFGSANGLTTNTSGIPGRELWTLTRTNVGENSQAGDAFGYALASGDFNGDGYSDLAIGIPYRTVTLDLFTHKEAGAVVVLYGSSSGLSAQSATFIDAGLFDRNYPSTISLDYAHLGKSLAWGNFNGDQYNGHDVGDLAIGIPDATLVDCFLCFTSYSNVGAVWVLAGNPGTGLSQTLLTNFFTESDRSSSIGAHFGASLSAGDFDGDKIYELVVGAPNKVVSGVAAAGHVLVYKRPLNGSPVTYEWSLNKLQILAQADDLFGASLATGDFNGDDKADLAIGIPRRNAGGQSDAGSVFVMYGPGPEDLSPAVGGQFWDETAIGSTPQSNDRFGTAIATGDFNGDGRTDLAVGVPYKAVVVNRSGSLVTLLNAGEVDVIYGSTAGLSTSFVRSPQRWNQDTAFGAGKAASGNRFGAPLSAWNFGRNEVTGFYPLLIVRKTADLTIGVPYQSVNGVSGAGAVDVMYGSFVSQGLTNSGNVIFTADSIGLGGLAGAHFGAAVY